MPKSIDNPRWRIATRSFLVGTAIFGAYLVDRMAPPVFTNLFPATTQSTGERTPVPNNASSLYSQVREVQFIPKSQGGEISQPSDITKLGPGLYEFTYPPEMDEQPQFYAVYPTGQSQLALIQLTVDANQLPQHSDVTYKLAKQDRPNNTSDIVVVQIDATNQETVVGVFQPTDPIVHDQPTAIPGLRIHEAQIGTLPTIEGSTATTDITDTLHVYVSPSMLSTISYEVREMKQGLGLVNGVGIITIDRDHAIVAIQEGNGQVNFAIVSINESQQLETKRIGNSQVLAVINSDKSIAGYYTVAEMTAISDGQVIPQGIDLVYIQFGPDTQTQITDAQFQQYVESGYTLSVKTTSTFKDGSNQTTLNAYLVRGRTIIPVTTTIPLSVVEQPSIILTDGSSFVLAGNGGDGTAGDVTRPII